MQTRRKKTNSLQVLSGSSKEGKRRMDVGVQIGRLGLLIVSKTRHVPVSPDIPVSPFDQVRFFPNPMRDEGRGPTSEIGLNQ